MSLAQQNADPEIEFQSPCLNLISDEAKSFIRRLAALDLFHCPTQRFNVTLAYPHPHHHHHYRHITPRLPLPRRHNWSPRARWHSALTDIRPPTSLATLLLLLRVARACKAVVDGTTKIRVHASLLKHCRRRRKRRMTLAEATLRLVLLNLLIENCPCMDWIRKNLDDFLTLLLVK